MALYPLKFKAILKETLWGGQGLNKHYNKGNKTATIGESWEISGVSGNESIVSNGFLKDNNLNELIEIYMGDLVGDEVYNTFGNEFPLLIKFIDAQQDLSVQVHPNDQLAKQRHQAYGKTEMWYILEAEKGARLINGFVPKTDKLKYLEAFKNKQLDTILNYEAVEKGDTFFIPAGRVHAIGPGIVLAEIQQTSDVTYRIFDWNRKDKDGKERELHTDLAVEAIDFSEQNLKALKATAKNNETAELASCKYFTSRLLNFDKRQIKTYETLDSFVIYMCTEGSFDIEIDHQKIEQLSKGECVLIPATIDELGLVPHEASQLIEVYIEQK